MIKSYTNAWKKAFDFKGRSSRKDYWFFQLFTGILISVMLLIYFFINKSPLFYQINIEILYKFLEISLIFFLLFLFGTAWVSIPLTVRRIRDVGMRWYWIFFVLIPYIGELYILIFLTRTSVTEIEGKKYFPKY